VTREQEEASDIVTELVTRTTDENRMRTRSRGPATEYPYVQIETLEYLKK
jgi:hypothetical protein